MGRTFIETRGAVVVSRLSGERVVRVDVDADPAVFLTGPARGVNRDDWREGATAAVLTDFALPDDDQGRAYAAYLEGVIAAFSRWEASGDLTFLRLASPGDEPVPVSLEVHHPLDEGPSWTAEEFSEAVMSTPDDVRIIGEVSKEDVEGAPGWRRLVFYTTHPSAGVVSTVRYHRRFDLGSDGAEVGADVVLRAGGTDPGTTIELLGQLDVLAATVDLVPVDVS
jgi:hypothetical protein